MNLCKDPNHIHNNCMCDFTDRVIKFSEVRGPHSVSAS